MLDFIGGCFFFGALVMIFFDPVTSIACWIGLYMIREINV